MNKGERGWGKEERGEQVHHFRGVERANKEEESGTKNKEEK